MQRIVKYLLFGFNIGFTVRLCSIPVGCCLFVKNIRAKRYQINIFILVGFPLLR